MDGPHFAKFSSINSGIIKILLTLLRVLTPLSAQVRILSLVPQLIERENIVTLLSATAGIGNIP